MIALSLLTPRPAAAQEAGEPRLQIETPAAGEAVQGLVRFSASIPNPDNRGGSLSFRYAGFPDANWFPIWQSEQPLVSGELTVWDTTTITDGTYDVRLQILLGNGELDESLAAGIRVRNYTPVETTTPAPTLTIAPDRTNTPLPPTATRQAEPPTPAPTLINSASLSEDQVYRTMLAAGAGVMGVFLITGLYFGISTILRRRG